MEGISSQIIPAAVHIRFLIFDWSIPNLVMGVIVIVAFFAAAWARLPAWIERGRDRNEEAGK